MNISCDKFEMSLLSNSDCIVVHHTFHQFLYSQMTVLLKKLKCVAVGSIKRYQLCWTDIFSSMKVLYKRKMLKQARESL